MLHTTLRAFMLGECEVHLYKMVPSPPPKVEGAIPTLSQKAHPVHAS